MSESQAFEIKAPYGTPHPAKNRGLEAMLHQREAKGQLAQRLHEQGVSIADYVPKTLAEALLLQGHDEDFRPMREPKPLDAPPGSRDRIVELRARVARGESLFAEGDVNCLPTIADISLGRDYREPSLPS